MEHEKQIANLKMQINSIDYFDLKYYTISDSLERELDKVIAAKNEDMLEFSDAYGGTFTGDILAKLYMEPSRPEGEEFETHRSYESRHYLDYVPWGDDRVYNSRMLSEKVFNLLANLTTFSEVALVNRVNEVMDASIAAEGNEIMTAGILSYVLMFNNGPQNVFEVAARPYFSECTSGGPFDEICNRIAQIDRAANGINIPSVNIETTDGGNMSLRDNASSTYLLAVWSPDCPKCLKALPDMFSFEDEMGISVRMLALGGEPEIVNKLFESYGGEEISGILKEGWKDPLITELQITSTPEYMLVNNEHEIISRWYNLQELKEYLSSSQQ
jgi:thiol-disulfide isomerase/thioredoxin